MDASASITEDSINKDQARELAGPAWDEARFDIVANAESVVSREN
jgi:hypothetical protein